MTTAFIPVFFKCRRTVVAEWTSWNATTTMVDEKFDTLREDAGMKVKGIQVRLKNMEERENECKSAKLLGSITVISDVQHEIGVTQAEAKDKIRKIDSSIQQLEGKMVELEKGNSSLNVTVAFFVGMQ